jgi:hypothetical protein
MEILSEFCPSQVIAGHISAKQQRNEAAILGEIGDAVFISQVLWRNPYMRLCLKRRHGGKGLSLTAPADN